MCTIINLIEIRDFKRTIVFIEWCQLIWKIRFCHSYIRKMKEFLIIFKKHVLVCPERVAQLPIWLYLIILNDNHFFLFEKITDSSTDSRSLKSVPLFFCLLQSLFFVAEYIKKSNTPFWWPQELDVLMAICYAQIPQQANNARVQQGKFIAPWIGTLKLYPIKS